MFSPSSLAGGAQEAVATAIDPILVEYTNLVYNQEKPLNGDGTLYPKVYFEYIDGNIGTYQGRLETSTYRIKGSKGSGLSATMAVFEIGPYWFSGGSQQWVRDDWPWFARSSWYDNPYGNQFTFDLSTNSMGYSHSFPGTHMRSAGKSSRIVLFPEAVFSW